MPTVNGRHARYYFTADVGAPDRFYLAVTYHRPGTVHPSRLPDMCHANEAAAGSLRWERRARQLTVSPKLLKRVLREEP